MLKIRKKYAACFAALNEFRFTIRKPATHCHKAAFKLLVKPFARICCMLSYRSRIARCSQTKFRCAHSYGFTRLVNALRSSLSFTSLRCRFRGFRLPDYSPSAFTLAEVLITLTILGIIAVVVIPNIVQNYKKIMVETKLKLIYSQLSSVIDQMNVEYKPIAQIVDESFALGAPDRLHHFVNSYFEQYLKFTKKCGYRRSGCTIFKAENKNENVGVTYIKMMNGSNGPSPSDMYQYSLPNRMFLGILDNGSPNGAYFNFVVDLNGSVGPNQVGSDIFYFSVYDTKADTSFNGKNQNSLDCGRDANYGTAMNSCNSNGKTCSCAIKNNNWKIPKNYPAKL